MNKWRLISSGFSDAFTNMAVDEALFLERISGNSSSTLRIYGWRPAAYSFGYFQKVEKELDLPACGNKGIDVVRRMTGGGIIYHDQELTYSITCSKDDLKAANTKDSFKELCSFIIKGYGKMGIKADFADELNIAKKNKREFSSFCFNSNEESDLIVEGRKIGGNSQRRRKNIIFQHGSIPIRIDIEKSIANLHKPPCDIEKNISSLESILKKKLTFSELEHTLTESFKQTFKVELKAGSLTEKEGKLVNELRKKGDRLLFKGKE
ncbi:MAG: lipoate--protein ligase family protein [Candidatus Omnitrophica bacterium]|nr:lipoate--protein ligase family protein [Candidatus Omnitrophota bacterium]